MRGFYYNVIDNQLESIKKQYEKAKESFKEFNKTQIADLLCYIELLKAPLNSLKKMEGCTEQGKTLATEITQEIIKVVSNILKMAENSNILKMAEKEYGEIQKTANFQQKWKRLERSLQDAEKILSVSSEDDKDTKKDNEDNANPLKQLGKRVSLLRSELTIKKDIVELGKKIESEPIFLNKYQKLTHSLNGDLGKKIKAYYLQQNKETRLFAVHSLLNPLVQMGEELNYNDFLIFLLKDFKGSLGSGAEKPIMRVKEEKPVQQPEVGKGEHVESKAEPLHVSRGPQSDEEQDCKDDEKVTTPSNQSVDEFYPELSKFDPGSLVGSGLTDCKNPDFFISDKELDEKSQDYHRRLYNIIWSAKEILLLKEEKVYTEVSLQASGSNASATHEVALLKAIRTELTVGGVVNMSIAKRLKGMCDLLQKENDRVIGLFCGAVTGMSLYDERQGALKAFLLGVRADGVAISPGPNHVPASAQGLNLAEKCRALAKNETIKHRSKLGPGFKFFAVLIACLSGAGTLLIPIAAVTSSWARRELSDALSLRTRTKGKWLALGSHFKKVEKKKAAEEENPGVLPAPGA